MCYIKMASMFQDAKQEEIVTVSLSGVNLREMCKKMASMFQAAKQEEIVTVSLSGVILREMCKKISR